MANQKPTSRNNYTVLKPFPMGPLCVQADQVISLTKSQVRPLIYGGFVQEKEDAKPEHSNPAN